MSGLTWEEWGELAALMDNWWGQPEMTEHREQAYFELLQDYPRDRVEAAIYELLGEGSEFTPSAAALLAKVIIPEEDGSLRFGHALRVITDAIRSADAERFLSTEHPLYTRFLAEHPELPTADLSNDRYLRDLTFAWEALVQEWRAGIRKNAARAGMRSRSLARSGGRELPGEAREIGAGDGPLASIRDQARERIDDSA
jgi:hypothetical protein